MPIVNMKAMTRRMLADRQMQNDTFSFWMKNAGVHHRYYAAKRGKKTARLLGMRGIFRGE